MDKEDVKRIMKIMQYEYPFMLVDKIIKHEKRRYLHTRRKLHNVDKRFLANGNGTPLTLPIEGLIQSVILFIYMDQSTTIPQRGRFHSLEKCQIKQSANISDAIVYRVARCSHSDKYGNTVFAGAAFADEKLIARARMLFLII